jgi:hypothetical protein
MRYNNRTSEHATVAVRLNARQQAESQCKGIFSTCFAHNLCFLKATLRSILSFLSLQLNSQPLPPPSLHHHLLFLSLHSQINVLCMYENDDDDDDDEELLC